MGVETKKIQFQEWIPGIFIYHTSSTRLEYRYRTGTGNTVQY